MNRQWMRTGVWMCRVVLELGVRPHTEFNLSLHFVVNGPKQKRWQQQRDAAQPASQPSLTWKMINKLMRQLNDSEWVVSSRHAPKIVICFSNTRSRTHITQPPSSTAEVEPNVETKTMDVSKHNWYGFFLLLCIFVFIHGINIFSVVALDGMESNWHIQNGDVRWMMDTLIYALFGCDGAHGRKCCSIHSPADLAGGSENGISPRINI